MAEDALGLMHSQWRRAADLLLAQAGPRFPAPSIDIKLEIGPIELFCQEIVVTRFVYEAIGQGLAIAEPEVAGDGIFKTKDQENSRLSNL